MEEQYKKSDYASKFTVLVDEELFNRIEDYRFENRFQTRKDAIVDLLKKGLEALEKEEEDNAEG